MTYVVQGENLIDLVYGVMDELRAAPMTPGDASQARNRAIAITHLEDAALRIGLPTWYRPNPPHGASRAAADSRMIR